MWLVAIALIVAVGIGAIAGASAMRASAAPAADAPTAVKHHSAFPATAAAPMAGYRQVVSNLAAAEERHDFAAVARFQKQLDSVLTARMIGTVYQEHQELMAALAASNRDSHAALILRRIAEICGPAAVKAQLEFCN